MRRVTLSWLIVLSVAPGLGAGDGGGPLRSPPHPAIVDQFLQRKDVPLTTYRAVRRLEARNTRFDAAGWMRVVTEFSADTGLRWSVIDEGGSGYIRKNVLRKALDAEAEAYRTGAPAKAALTDANYLFVEARVLDAGLTQVRVEPRRKDVLLVSGAIVLQGLNGDLVQVVGRLAKSPSAWTRWIDVVRTYARRNGVRVPVSMDSHASVRIAGLAEFHMTYDYQAINGAPVIDTPVTVVSDRAAGAQ